MAHALLVSDGTTSFSLTSESSMLEKYAMGAPTTGEPSVVDTIDIMIYAASGALVQSAVAVLQRLLDAAIARKRDGVGPAVYLMAQLDSDGNYWRSEIYDARLDLTEDTLSVWGNFKARFSLYIERAPWWDGALTQLTLTNANGTNNTSGLTIYNHDDGGAGHDNWVSVDAAEVTGNLPAPVKVEMTNTAGGARAVYQVFMATNAHNSPTAFTHLLEAESINVDGTDEADADCSNGNCNAHSGSNAWVMRYTLSSAVMGYCAGYPFHVLVRFELIPATIGRASILSSSGTALAQGDEYNITITSQDLFDFGLLYLPPGGYSAAWAAHTLQLGFRQTGSQSAQVDYIALFPAYAFRDLLTHGSSIANAASITDDPTEGRAYITSASVEYPEVQQRGNPVMLYPGRDQRIYFLWSLFDHTSLIGDTMTVKAWYRPRRATI